MTNVLENKQSGATRSEVDILLRTEFEIIMKRVAENPLPESLLCMCMVADLKILVDNIKKGIKCLFKAVKLISGSKIVGGLKGFINLVSYISKSVQCIIFIVEAVNLLWGQFFEPNEEFCQSLFI
ncbi:hypothetical protein DVH24_008613 [Malus domestica]|uniref:Uncharacterized protein n=1 Tax=Malus domestica TaxID=3750 RepID=A0A498JQG8_MALDO|nr:hypothetical protein DVH24_008613 [Malus domestica]